MAHLRKQIRDRITTTLTGLTTTGDNVYQTHQYPLAEGQLPGIAIYTNSHTFEPLSLTPPRTLMNELEVAIEIYVKGANSDDTLDAICEEIELALYEDSDLNGLAQDVYQSGIDIEYSGEGDQPVTLGRMTVRVEYTSVEGTQA